MPSRAATVAKKKTTEPKKPQAKSPEPLHSAAFLAQVAAAKKQHPDMIVLFSHEESYKAFDGDAEKVCKVLGMAVQKVDGVTYCWFEQLELEKVLGLLLRAGERVAVCEPADENQQVARIVSPESGLPEAEPEKPAEPAVEVRMVRLDAITVDKDLNPREEMDDEWISELAGIYKTDPKKLPKPVLFDDGEKLWLASGFHRTSGAADAGLVEIECEVRKGTRLDALVFAAGENKGHGRKRTPGDKRRAVENMLRACPKWSARQIALHVEVHHDLVSDVKKKIFPHAAREKTIGKDGKEYSPKKTKASAAKAEEPVAAAAPFWRSQTLEEAFEDEYDVPADVFPVLKAAGVTTCGELADRLLAGSTFDLKLVDVQALCESIELMSADDAEPVKFRLDEPDEFAKPLTPAPATAAPATASSPAPRFSPAGNWSWQEYAKKGRMDAAIEYKDGVITGTVGTAQIDVGEHYSNGTLTPDGRLTFWVTAEDAKGDWTTTKYSGNLTESQIRGSITYPDGKTSPWDARREVERLARDMLGRELPSFLRTIFSERKRFMEAARLVANGAQALAFTDTLPEFKGFLKTRPHLTSEPRQLAAYIRRNLAPYCVCPICDGDGDSGGCPTCAGKGWLTRRGFDEAAEPAREKAKAFKPGDAWEGDDAAEDREAPESNPTRYAPAGPGLDPTGHEIPSELRDLFAADWLQDEARRLDRLASLLRSSSSWLNWLKPETHAVAEQLSRLIRDAIPYSVCRACGGKATGCGSCKCSGYLPKYEHDNRAAKAKK